jgi:hypothetical protein
MYPRIALVNGAWGLDPDMVFRLYVNPVVAIMNGDGASVYKELFRYDASEGYGEPFRSRATIIDPLSGAKPNFHGVNYTLHNLGYIPDDDYPTLVLVVLRSSLISSDNELYLSIHDVDSFNPFTVEIISQLKNLTV